jgi:Exostosin family
MKVYLGALRETDQVEILQDHAAFSRNHEIVSSPSAADLILVLGASAREPQQLLDYEAYKAFPDRCAIYTEEDDYLPLLPTVHTNARRGLHTRIGRVFNYAHITRNGRHQNRYVGETTSAVPIGRTEQKRYLFSFLGGSTSIVRKRLFNLKFNRSDVLIENTSAYWHWDNSQPDRDERQRRYAETLAASHFALCPRGAGAGSSRFFEVMAAGVAPVLLSDEFELTPGPAWDQFLIRVRERDIARLPTILERHLDSAGERGRLARHAFDEYFAIDREFDCLVDLAARALRHEPPAEEYFRRRQIAMFRQFEWKRKTRAAVRSMALGALKALHLKNPYQMNR